MLFDGKFPPITQSLEPCGTRGKPLFAQVGYYRIKGLPRTLTRTLTGYR